MVLINACWNLDGHVTGSVSEPVMKTVRDIDGAYKCLLDS